MSCLSKSIIAKGASGGLGAGHMGSSRGAVARLVVELSKGQKLYILVGQRGSNAARKVIKEIMLDNFFISYLCEHSMLFYFIVSYRTFQRLWE